MEPIKGLGTYDCAGLFGPTCSGVYPAWKHKAQVVWNTPWQFSAALTWRYISQSQSRLHQLESAADGSLFTGATSSASQSYFDLALQWNVDKTFTIRAGINNLFDRDPPVVSSTAGAFPAISGPALGNGNTYPQAYDTLGRQLFLNVTAKF